jgi:hypothetical protein
MSTISGVQLATSVVKVESISDGIKALGAISCDFCNEKLASYDVYMNAGIVNVPFLKRYCSDCLQNVTQ